MTATLRHYSALSLTMDGLTRTVGSLQLPQNEISVVGDPVNLDQEFSVPAATDAATRSTWGRRTLYDHATDGLPTWNLLQLLIPVTGTLEIYTLYDVPTSLSDLNPTNTSTTRYWQARYLSNIAPATWDTPFGISNALVADLTGTNGSGLPVAATDGGTIQARLYKIVGYNPNLYAVTVRKRLVY